jgi:hypothetical protein
MLQNIYTFSQQIPDYVYPGGILAYQNKIKVCEALYGYAFKCKELFLWREMFHLFGGIILALIFVQFRKSNIAKILLFVIISYLVFQESYLHPQFAGQSISKSFTDLCFWLFPILAIKVKDML